MMEDDEVSPGTQSSRVGRGALRVAEEGRERPEERGFQLLSVVWQSLICGTREGVARDKAGLRYKA